MGTSRTSDNTKVPDFSFFDLKQIKTWKTEQSVSPSTSEGRNALNDVNVWAEITRYFGEKQLIIIESYSTVHKTLC